MVRQCCGCQMQREDKGGKQKKKKKRQEGWRTDLKIVVQTTAFKFLALLGNFLQLILHKVFHGSQQILVHFGVLLERERQKEKANKARLAMDKGLVKKKRQLAIRCCASQTEAMQSPTLRRAWPKGGGILRNETRHYRQARRSDNNQLLYSPKPESGGSSSAALSMAADSSPEA